MENNVKIQFFENKTMTNNMNLMLYFKVKTFPSREVNTFI